MGNFFSVDSPFMEYLEKVTDIIILSLLWLVFCIPIFTISTSTTAVYYVMINKVNKKDTYIFRSFFKSFKENFKQTFLLDIMFKVILFIIWVNIYIVGTYLETNDITKILLLGVQFILLIEVIFISIYLYALISKVKISTKEALKLSFLLSHKHLITTLLILLLIFVMLSMFYMYGNVLYLIVAPGIYFLLSSFLLVKVFRKYSDGFEKQKDAY